MKKQLLIIGMLFGSIVANSNTTINKYRIYCTTEAQNVYQWAEAAPTKCPNNTAHVINLNSISVVDQQGPSLLSIKEETTPTGGHYRAESKTVNAAAGPNVSSSLQFSWPYDVSVLAIYFMATTDNVGDIITVAVGPDTVYGVITQDVAAGTTVIPVNSTVITNIAKGYYVTVDDGTNADTTGRVVAIDTVNNSITVETATVYAFAAATPTYVKVTVRPIDTFELVAGMPYTFGIKKIGGSFIPANTPVQVEYVNNGSTPVSLVFGYEYLY